MLKAILTWLRGEPQVYPPWDFRSGPEVFCHWLTTGDDIRRNQQRPGVTDEQRKNSSRCPH